MRSHTILVTMAALTGLATPAHDDPNPDADNVFCPQHIVGNRPDARAAANGSVASR